MKFIKQLLLIPILFIVSAANAGFIPSNLLNGDLNDQSLYAAQGLTLGAGTDVGGNMQGSTAITTGVGSVVGGTVEAGTAVTTGAGSSVGRYIQAGTAVSTGVGAVVTGNIFSGTTTGVGATSTINGNIEAGGAVTIGIDGAVNGLITENLANGSGYSPPTVINQKNQLDRVQETLRQLGVTRGHTQLPITFGLVDETLTSGIYDSLNYLTIRADKTLTLDGQNKSGDFLFNVHNYLTFAAGAKVKLINFTDNSKVIWNVIGDAVGSSGYMDTGAGADVRGFIFANGFVKTGANSTIFGIGSSCGGAASVNNYVAFGADSTVGAVGCTLGGDDANAPHHFVISHDNNGIHCFAEPVHVIAKNEDQSTTTDYTGTITLDTQTGKGDWRLLTGNGSLVDATTVNDGLATYTFAAGDSGQATFALDYTEGAAIFDIDAYDVNVRDDDSEGDITYSDSGFTITASELFTPPPNDPILTQIAGKAFDVHLNAFGTLPNDKTCGIIESYTGSKNMTLTTTRLNPSSGVVNIRSAGSTTPTLTFVGGKASFTAKYKDVGQVQLNISDGTIIGSSNAFVVKPHRFEITLTGPNPFEAKSPDGTIFTSAGTNFDVTVTAKDFDGAITPNYGEETPTEAIALTGTLNQPSVANGGSNGNFYSNLSKPVEGISSGTANWSEVGTIDLIAEVGDKNYLGSGNVSYGPSTLTDVGRFTPATLLINVIEHGVFTATNSNKDGVPFFTYVGQPFSYSSEKPSFRVTALNALSTLTNPIPTLNYTGDWGKLKADSIKFTEPNEPKSDTNKNGKDGSTRMALTYEQDAAGFRDPTINANQPSAFKGIFDVTFTNDNFTYVKDRNSEVDPFYPSVNLVITSVTDSDSISTDSITLNPKGLDPIRFGRMRMSPASTDSSSLVMYYRLEYLDSPYWSLHDDRSSTIVIGNITSNPPVPSTDLIEATTLAGKFAITLSLPSDGKDGDYLITSDVLGSGEPWLRYDWDSDGNFDNNPSATATFGIYQGGSQQIYIKQP